MAHIRDRWFRTVTRPDGTHGREQSAQHGRGRRWQVRYLDADYRERSKSFDRKVDAETFHALKQRARIRADLLTADSDGIDPGGYYVYLLWEVRDDDKPVYVGSSGNILGRLGAHLADSRKRPQIGWITLIRCTSERAMLDRENVLIRRYRPGGTRRSPLRTAG
jgi:GIY-YIG catalytic domain